MRITGGFYKGRLVQCPPGVIRPAMDRMRESMFAILGDLTGTSFLDLYSGSGVVGIEAASRGAEPVVFVEKDPGKRAVLSKNTSFVIQAKEIHITPAERYLARFRPDSQAHRVPRAVPFDTVFLDPPFRQKGTLEVLRQILERGALAADGLLLVHLPREELLPEGETRAAGLLLADRREYGRSVLLFFRMIDTGR